MKKILVLFATVVVMMMVTGCENPANVHIPTQEELWVAEGYRYCGDVVNELDNSAVSQFFVYSECEYKLTENGKYYVKFPLNNKIVANKEWIEIGCEEWVTGYYFTYHTRLCIFKNGNGELYKLVIEDENNPLY